KKQLVTPTNAYSTARKLVSDYAGSALKVRRFSDNATLDIGFSSDELNTSAMEAFTGAGDGFMDTLNDQRGVRNFRQTTLVFQPKIVDAGSTIKVSKPFMKFDGVND